MRPAFRVPFFPLGAFTVLILGACAKIDSQTTPTGDAGRIPVNQPVDAAAPDRPGVVVDSGPPAPPPCVGLACQQMNCPAGGTTSVSGTVFAPNGTLPLFNVTVFVPNGPLAALADGVTCDRCGARIQNALVSAASDEKGQFKLTNVPVGKDIPLVVQVGKWRRRATIPNVAACTETALTDPELTRLPRNRTEGDMPRIAVTTGGCDSLACILPKVGVDKAEMGIAGDNKAVTFFRGGSVIAVGPLAGASGPPNSTPATDLWRDESALKKYDLALLSCECSEQLTEKGAAAYDAMTKYLSEGGRIFGSDFMYVWYQHATDAALAGALDIGGGAPPAKNPMTIDTSFPKGKALADWMKFVDPAVTYGQITADQVFDNFNSAMPASVQVWASSESERMTAEQHPRIVTVNTPVGAPKDQQCGRAVHLDAHISSVGGVLGPRGMGGATTFPEVCGTKLNKGEEALAFLFFDLAACVQNDQEPVVIP